MGCGASKAPVGPDMPTDSTKACNKPTAETKAEAHTLHADETVVQRLVAYDARVLALATKSYDAETGTELVWPDDSRGEEERGQWKRSRSRILQAAQRVGAAREALNCPPRHILLIYNPISGGGRSKALVDNVVVPVFRLAGVDFTLVRTEFQGFCSKYIKTLAVGNCDCIAIAGGDGLLLEAVSGYMGHSDTAGLMAHSPLASIPTGTANAMARQLHTAESPDYCHMVGCSALSAVLGTTTRVDMFKLVDSGLAEPLYALSCFGWGMAAIITEKAERLRKSVPKRIRYDVATAICVMKKWPVSVVADVSLKESSDSDWVRQDNFTVGNLLATNMPKLGPKHVIHSNVEVNDGRAGLVYTLPTTKKVDLWRANNKMKLGHALSDAKGWESGVFSELKMTLKDRKAQSVCIMLDGDPAVVQGNELHITVLEKALPIHVMPWSLAKEAVHGTPDAVTEIEAIVHSIRALTAAVNAGKRAVSTEGMLSRSSLSPMPSRPPSTQTTEVLSRRSEKGMGKVATCPDGVRIMSRPSALQA
eukprot:m.179899 g.179899  ORF g.179899 m.179899 type:complete len:534 (+) comp14880_c0_seq1:210-1811(+)